MSDPTTSVQSTTAAAPTANAAAPANNGTAASTPAKFPSTYKSLDDFRKKNPKMYEAFMNGIAQSMIQDLKKGADRVKEAMKKARQNS